MLLPSSSGWYTHVSNPATFVVCLVILVLWLILSSFARARVNDIISSAINAFLCAIRPIKTLDGKRTLPTCPYRWPNGQGDVGKFLEGMENSELWGQKHGKIYRIWSGMTSEIVLTQPEDVQAVFKDSHKHVKAVNNNGGWLMGEILGKCVGLISGTEWQALRCVTSVPFLHTKATGYIPLIERRTKQHLDSLQSQGRLNQGLVNPVDDLKLLPFWIIADIIYGELSSDMEAELQALIPVRELLFRQMISGKLSRFGFSKYLPSEINRNLSRFKNAWGTFNDVARKRSLANGTSTPIVQMYSEVQSGTISHDQLCQTLDEMLFANLDVTIGGISWNLLFLGAHQYAQVDLRNEIIDKRREAQTVPGQWEDYLLSSSTVLFASILESARLKPLAAFSVPQAAPTDRTVSGFLVPAGTDFVIDSHSLHMRNPYWGEDTEEYRPRRFLERKILESRYNYWRYGFGPRTCMGRYVADLIMKILLVHLVENYRFSLVEHGKDWDRNAETWILHPNTDVLCERILYSSPDIKD